jgi:hypothetical protein
MWGRDDQFIRHVKKNRNHYKFSGSGATNNGNIACHFSVNPFPFPAVTDVNEKLIARFGTTRQAISSGLPIDSDTSNQYSKEMIVLCLQDSD